LTPDSGGVEFLFEGWCGLLLPFATLWVHPLSDISRSTRSEKKLRGHTVILAYIYTFPLPNPQLHVCAFLVRPLPARDDLGSWVLNGLSEFEFAMMHVYLIA